MKFFVLLDEKERICDVFHVDKLGVYEKKEIWQCIMYCNLRKLAEDNFNIENTNDKYTVEDYIDVHKVSEEKTNQDSRLIIEHRMDQIISTMKANESNMVIGSAIVGIPYQIFNRHDINMCETDELSQELFDAINQDFYCDVNINAVTIVLVWELEVYEFWTKI